MTNTASMFINQLGTAEDHGFEKQRRTVADESMIIPTKTVETVIALVTCVQPT